MTELTDTGAEPPRYRLLRPTTDHMGSIVPAGAIIQHEGVPNRFMVPVNVAARTVAQRCGISSVENPAPQGLL